ncbi:hypothetical protein BKA93DRAFT_89137 [Sparassis latifolia]
MSNQDLSEDRSPSHKAESYYELKGKGLTRLSSAFANAQFLPEELEDYVTILVDIADVLGIDDLSFSSFSNAICSLSSEELSLKRSSLRMQYAQDELLAHLASAEHLESLTQKWIKTIQAEPDPNASVSALERRKAALFAKAKEYQAELDAIMSQMPETPPVTATQLHALHKELKVKEQQLKEKRARVEAFQGVPPNLELARHELRNARDEQMKLIQLRERLLDRMASGMN